MNERNDLCRCGSGKKYKKCCMRDHSKGGSPTEKRPVKQIPSVPMRTVPEGAIPQIVGFAAYGMMQRMRMEERMRIKQEEQ